jgi:ABC-2 type transport system ATP-binding protein
MTSITLDAATIGEGLGADVPSLSLFVPAGIVSVVAVETDERPMLVSMLFGGRVRADSGSVLVDGRDDPAELRERTALVDTPFVSEPPAGVSLATTIAEELSFADKPTSRAAVDRVLDRHHLADYAALPVRSLPATARIQLFTELAVLRPSVDTIVLTSPERHGADPAEWFPTLVDLTDRGLTVVVVTDSLTRNSLLSLGANDATALLNAES